MSDNPLIYARMAAIMAEVPAIGKDQRNQEQRYAFRGVDDVYNALHGLFAKHDVFVIPEVIDADYIQQERTSAKGRTNLVTDARLRISYHFYTSDGSSVTATVQGESRDYADKATNQATSSAIKYLLLQVFLIPTEDTVEADHRSPIVGEAVEDDIDEAEKARLHANAVKVQLVDLLGTEEAAQFWDTYQELGSPDAILEHAKKYKGAGAPPPAVSLEDLDAMILQSLDGLKKQQLETLVRALARMAEATGYIPAGEKDIGGYPDWLHFRLSRVGVEHVATLKVAELRTFIEAMQSDVSAARVTGGER